MKDATQIAAMVASINQDFGTSYQLLGKMERGTNGAWLIASPDGTKSIFKPVSADDVTAQIARSANYAAAVHGVTSPTPRYDLVEYRPETGSFYIQELLSGIPSERPSPMLVQQMIRLNHKQAGLGTAGGINWSERVKSELFGDAAGWQKLVGNFDDSGRELVGRVVSLIAPYADIELNCSDMVHGDFQHFNALVESDRCDRLTGYVDWDGAGFGDRAFDLARLLYDVYVAEYEIGYRVNPMSVIALRQHILNCTNRSAFELYMSYWILQVAKFAVNCKTAEATHFFQVGHRIFDTLEHCSLRQAA